MWTIALNILESYPPQPFALEERQVPDMPFGTNI